MENKATVAMINKHNAGIDSMMDSVYEFSRENPEAVDDLALTLNRLQESKRIIA